MNFWKPKLAEYYPSQSIVRWLIHCVDDNRTDNYQGTEGCHDYVLGTMDPERVAPLCLTTVTDFFDSTPQCIPESVDVDVLDDIEYWKPRVLLPHPASGYWTGLGFQPTPTSALVPASRRRPIPLILSKPSLVDRTSVLNTGRVFSDPNRSLLGQLGEQPFFSLPVRRCIGLVPEVIDPLLDRSTHRSLNGR